MIQAIEFVNFRNLKKQRVEFSPEFNALVGSNGQGKTNVLEAVYYLSLLRSFRTAQVNDLRQWKTDAFRLTAWCRQGNRPRLELEIIYGDDRKKLAINGNHVYRTSEFINQFICVTFIPQDMELIRGSEALRRKFLDIAISQLSPAYLKSLQAYNEALKARNTLLREQGKYGEKVLGAYDRILVENGVKVERERRNFTARLNQELREISPELMEQQKTLNLKYVSGIAAGKQEEQQENEQELMRKFQQTLEHNRQRDLRDGFTHAGPHRAEFACLLNDASLKHFGSEGECRMASLAVKFACLDIIRKQQDPQKITLLVDDVIGELDERRQRKFFQKLQGAGQIIMAGTEIPKTLTLTHNVMRVSEGTVTKGENENPRDAQDGRP